MATFYLSVFAQPSRSSDILFCGHGTDWGLEVTDSLCKKSPPPPHRYAPSPAPSRKQECSSIRALNKYFLPGWRAWASAANGNAGQCNQRKKVIGCVQTTTKVGTGRAVDKGGTTHRSSCTKPRPAGGARQSWVNWTWAERVIGAAGVGTITGTDHLYSSLCGC